MKQPSEVTRHRDGCGEFLAVNVRNAPAPVLIDAADYASLTTAKGITNRAWFLSFSSRGGYGYVRVDDPLAPGGMWTIAREIMRAKRGQCVKYRDGNPLNLRRFNLFVAPAGQAKHHSAAIFDELNASTTADAHTTSR